MKFIPLINSSDSRISVSQVRGADGRPLSFGVGEVKSVHPNNLNHPALKSYLGAGLDRVVDTDDPEPVIPAPAPAPKPTPKAVPAPAPAPPQEDVSEDEDEGEDEEEDEDEDLTNLYLSAPGITARNVEDILAEFPSVESLVDAEADALVDCGVSKSFTSRLLEWAIDQV